MRSTKQILGILLVLLITGCAIVNVGYDQDRAADFRQYKTFAWYTKDPAKFKNDQFDNQILESNIKNLVSGQLKRRGFSVDLENPDLLFDYDFMIEKKMDQQQVPVYSHPYNSAYSNPYNYSTYNNPYNYNTNMAYASPMNNQPQIVGYQTQSIPYKDGTLTISTFDRKTNRLIWRGWGEGALTDEQTYESQLPEVIVEIFKNFPVDGSVQRPPRTQTQN